MKDLKNMVVESFFDDEEELFRTAVVERVFNDWLDKLKDHREYSNIRYEILPDGKIDIDGGFSLNFFDGDIPVDLNVVRGEFFFQHHPFKHCKTDSKHLPEYVQSLRFNAEDVSNHTFILTGGDGVVEYKNAVGKNITLRWVPGKNKKRSLIIDTNSPSVICNSLESLTLINGPRTIRIYRKNTTLPERALKCILSTVNSRINEYDGVRVITSGIGPRLERKTNNDKFEIKE